jgi:predicted phage-related endonuclease
VTAWKDSINYFIKLCKGENIMSTIDIISKIEELNELEKLIEEAKAEAEALKDEIKNEMLKQNKEEMEVGKYIIRWTSVLSNRFDSTAFKRVMPDVYKAYVKQTASRRFSISG